MSITIAINQKLIKGEESSLQIHYMPAKICGDGEANVDKYFNNYTAVEQGYLTNALRGYPLQGAALNVPPGYKGVVVQEAENPLDNGADRVLRATGTFGQFNYWNYDRVPSKSDAYTQALQIVDVAAELAIPVTEADVLHELEERSKKSQKDQ